MLGCAHEDDSQTIAKKISRLKQLAEFNQRAGVDFVPGLSKKGKVYFTRREVDARFGIVTATAANDLTTAFNSENQRSEIGD